MYTSSYLSRQCLDQTSTVHTVASHHHSVNSDHTFHHSKCWRCEKRSANLLTAQGKIRTVYSFNCCKQIRPSNIVTSSDFVTASFCCCKQFQENHKVEKHPILEMYTAANTGKTPKNLSLWFWDCLDCCYNFIMWKASNTKVYCCWKKTRFADCSFSTVHLSPRDLS